MHKVQDILIPTRFTTLMLQIVFSMVAIFVRNTNAKISINQETASNSIIAACVLFYIFEVAELVILFIGITLFLNQLSLFQIICHTLSVALFGWYIFKQWDFTTLWAIWAVGSLLPVLFECGGMFYIYLFYRKVLRLT